MIIKMNINEVQSAEYNPRIDLKPGMPEYEKLRKSILEFGLVDPPIYNKRTGNIVGGHQRIAVVKELGLFEEIDVSVIDLPLEKEKALNVALNKITGKWDDEKLSVLLEEMEKSELNLTGFDDNEIEKLIGEIEIPNFEPGTIDEQGDLTSLIPKIVKCPCCGEEFDLNELEN